MLYQFNEKYVPYAGISLTSLLENNRKIDEIVIYVLPERVSIDSKKKIEKLAEKYGRQVVYINARPLIDKMKQMGLNDYRGSYATNMKMFAPDYIDDNLERLLYIDSDTIINDYVGELIDIDMKGNPISMVLDSCCGNHKRQIGHKREDMYFNGGVILFDLKEWKKRKCTERITQHIKNVRSCYMAPDQDILNVVLRGEITKLGIEYNLQPLHMAYSFDLYSRYFAQPNYYTQTEIQEAIENPKILHTFRFLGEFPWHKETLHPQVQYFDKYMKDSLWCNYNKESTEKNTMVFRMERWMYIHIPKNIFIVIFKMYYEFFLWKSNRDSLKSINNKNM